MDVYMFKETKKTKNLNKILSEKSPEDITCFVFDKEIIKKLNIQECFCNRAIVLFYAILNLLVEKENIACRNLDMKELGKYFMLQEKDVFDIVFVNNALLLLEENISHDKKQALMKAFKMSLGLVETEEIKKLTPHEVETYELFLNTIKKLFVSLSN